MSDADRGGAPLGATSSPPSTWADVAPPIEGEAQTLSDAAFWLYLRGATNFAGGRQLEV